MKFLSELLFRFLRFTSRWFLRILYPAMMVEGEEHVDRSGPYMLAGNHPNTLIDPLIQGIHIPGRLHFMANAGMFTNPLAYKFLRFAGVIPIVRPGVDKNEKVDNNNSFRLAYEHFEQGGIMFVAPEGGSELERRLRAPVKMGTAKMAFTVEEKNDWSLGLVIVPAGGNYEAPTRCFSRAFIRFGAPIKIADFREIYEKSPRRGIVMLTREIGKRMAELVIDTKDKAEEYLLRPLDRALQNDQPLLVADHHYRVQSLLSGLRELPEENRGALAEKASRYESLLKAAKIDDAVLSDAPAKKGGLGVWLGLPLFLWGAINHALIIWLAEFAYRKSGAEYNYAATIRGLVGSISLPIIYLLQTLLFSFLLPGGWALLYLLNLPVFGIFALGYYTTYYPYWTTVFNKRKVSKEMISLRADLRQATTEILGA